MNATGILITAFIFLLFAGVPSFIVYKLNSKATTINAIIFVLLTIWIVPGFSFLSLLVYFMFFALSMTGNVMAYQENNMTDEERKDYYRKLSKESTNKPTFNYEKTDIVKCTNCSSHNVEHLSNKRKKFSVGKAVGGTILTGGIGSLAGFIGKKGKKNEWHCKNCGNMFVK